MGGSLYFGLPIVKHHLNNVWKDRVCEEVVVEDEAVDAKLAGQVCLSEPHLMLARVVVYVILGP